MSDIKAAVQQQFGNVAEEYRKSAVHASGEDLTRMVEIAGLNGTEHVLDAGCGAGHTALAFAPHVSQVVAYDLTASMLEQVERLANERDIQNVTTRKGDVENLPFEDHTFDVVVSRYSAHHWASPTAALSEFRRVLKPEGQFILSDIVAFDTPLLDTFLQAIELLRDPSHVRDHSIKQWLEMCGEAGFNNVDVPFQWMLPLNFDAWVARIATPPMNVAMLKALFDGAPDEIGTTMNVQSDYTFSIPGALFRCTLQ